MKKIKLFDPSIGNEEKFLVNKVLDSKFWASGSGNGYVSEFENKIKKYIGCRNSIAVNSGTAALNLALSLVNIQNKEVIVPSLTFVSTVHAIKLNHGIPIFVDVDANTGCMSTENLEKLISNKTKAILPVHFGGMPCNIKKISDVCKSHKLHLIEDAAHAIGSTFKKKKIGSHGKFVCFSFHPVKNLAMPTGGLIALNDSDHSKSRKRLESKRWCGITNRKNMQYDVEELGNNYYMNEFSAAIGLMQLKKLDKMNSIRKKIAKKYNQKINLDNKIPFDQNCSYHLYWILVKNRDEFIKKMIEKNIEVGIHYKPVHQMTFYKTRSKLPNTDYVGRQIVSLPMHPNLTADETDKIIQSVNKYAK